MISVSEDGMDEIWWDWSVETTQKMQHNRPDVTVLDRDNNLMAKEDEKIHNYSLPLAREIRKMHRVSTKVIPLVVGCLWVVSSR